jgi:hypothetical protein
MASPSIDQQSASRHPRTSCSIFQVSPRQLMVTRDTPNNVSGFRREEEREGWRSGLDGGPCLDAPGTGNDDSILEWALRPRTNRTHFACRHNGRLSAHTRGCSPAFSPMLLLAASQARFRLARYSPAASTPLKLPSALIRVHPRPNGSCGIQRHALWPPRPRLKSAPRYSRAGLC